MEPRRVIQPTTGFATQPTLQENLATHAQSTLGQAITGAPPLAQQSTASTVAENLATHAAATLGQQPLSSTTSSIPIGSTFGGTAPLASAPLGQTGIPISSTFAQPGFAQQGLATSRLPISEPGMALGGGGGFTNVQGEICAPFGQSNVVEQTIRRELFSTDARSIESFQVPTALPSDVRTVITETPPQLASELNKTNFATHTTLPIEVIEHNLPKREVIHHEVLHPTDVRSVEHFVRHNTQEEVERHIVPHEVIHEVEHRVPHVIHHEVIHEVPHQVHHEVEHLIQEKVLHRVEHDVHQDVHHEIEHEVRQDVHHAVSKGIQQEVLNPVVCEDTKVPHSVSVMEKNIGGLVECVDTTGVSTEIAPELAMKKTTTTTTTTTQAKPSLSGRMV